MQPDFFFIRVNRKYQRVDYCDMICIEAMGSYTRVVTEQGTHVTLVSLKEWEEVLPPALFVRVSKSYILYLPKVTLFDANRASMGDKVFSVTKERRKNLYLHPTVIGQVYIQKLKRELAID